MWEVKKVVSKGDYNYAVVPNHPDSNEHGYVLEHRVVAENNLGRRLRDSEIVHHQNGDKKDNRWENLVVKDESIHVAEHNRGQGVVFCLLKCPNCQKLFVRRKGQTHLDKKTDRTSCSRPCNGSIPDDHSPDRNFIGFFRARRNYLEKIKLAPVG